MISIVTPSLNQSDWLRLAVASVADQTEVDREHIVQDSLSSDGTRDWLSKEPQLHAFYEKDGGMYDAINRGLLKAHGEICAYLNCDEQYLPGALFQVVEAFQRDEQMDVLLAGSIVVNEHGDYICSRPALKPSLRQLRAGHMYNLTASMFFRSRIIRERNILFNPNLRVIGDLDWLRRVVEAGCCVGTLAIDTSIFSDLGTNLALGAEASAESMAQAGKNRWTRVSSRALVASHRFKRLLAGHYSLGPLDYSIYTRAKKNVRATFHIARPTGVWRNRL
jgi:glycosyltransferase involved in cell wall biosynthesis